MRDSINRGDLVLVRFGPQIHDDIRGIVQHSPQQTGDSWVIREKWPHMTEFEPLHYVQQFAVMTLLETGKP